MGSEVHVRLRTRCFYGCGWQGRECALFWLVFFLFQSVMWLARSFSAFINKWRYIYSFLSFPVLPWLGPVKRYWSHKLLSILNTSEGWKLNTQYLAAQKVHTEYFVLFPNWSHTNWENTESASPELPRSKVENSCTKEYPKKLYDSSVIRARKNIIVLLFVVDLP